MPKYQILLCAALCTACTVGPDYQPPEVYENAQIAQALKLTGQDLSVSSDWYKMFNDTTLDGLIAEALKNSPTVQSALARLKEARLTSAMTHTAYLPMFNATGEYEWSRVGKNSLLTTDTNDIRVGFDASWEFDLWGAGRRADEAATAKLGQALYTLNNVKAVLTGETANTYFQLKTALEKKRIAQENLILQEKIFRTVKQKFEAGLIDTAAYHQAQYAVDTTLATLPVLENQIESYKNALAVLLGVLPDSLPSDILLPAHNPIRQAYRYDTTKLYRLPADIIRTRPDVMAAERALAAQNAAIGQAVAALYPSVDITALFVFQSSAGSRLFNRDNKNYGYTPTLNLPIWNWEKLQNEIRYQTELKDEVFQSYRQTVLAAVQELADAMSAVRTEYDVNRAQRRAVQNMWQVLNATLKKYENGLIEFSDLLTAEQNLLTAQTDLATSNGMIYQDIIAFYKATGGGYN